LRYEDLTEEQQERCSRFFELDRKLKIKLIKKLAEGSAHASSMVARNSLRPV
jgi:hypothetical protein